MTAFKASRSPARAARRHAKGHPQHGKPVVVVAKGK